MPFRAPRRAPWRAGIAPALLLLALAAPGPLVAEGGEAGDGLTEHVYTMRYQSAGEAVALVQRLLSRRGTVELRPAANTLVLRDAPEALVRTLEALVAFDHPAHPVDVELWLVKASGSRVSPPSPPRTSGVPSELVKALSDHLPYEAYSLIGSSRVSGLEGERLVFQVGGDYAVRFRLGTVVNTQRLRLNDFEVVLMPPGGEAAPLIKSQLNLWLGRTMVLALSAGTESNTALMVMVRCHTPPAPQVARKKGP